MSKPFIFMFSGQGSQYYHMGSELFQKQNIFQYWMRKLDHVACKAIGVSIIDIIYNREKRKSDLFDRMLHTSPAIFMVEYSLAMVLIENNICPDIVLGSSLGEFIAVAISGVITPEEILVAVIEQAKTIEKECKNGGMLAILHEKKLYYDTPLLNKNGELSSINFHSHFVVSGTKENLEKIENFLKRKEIIYQYLPVLYPFHSSLIDSAAQSFKSFLKHLKFNEPKIPIISCSGAGLLKRVENEHLWDVVRKPILFEDTIRDLEAQGDHVYIDIGPSGTLANYVKYNLFQGSNSISTTIMTPFGQDIQNFEKIVNSYKKRNRFEVKKTMKAYVFPGQGSQNKGMGGNLFEHFNNLTAKADSILGYSIKELCINDPHKKLNKTEYTQPALYVVNALMHLKKIEDGEPIPDFVAGHSLGEYNALLAAGAFDFETGLKLVKKRGELIGKASGGSMAAVVGLSEEQVVKILRSSDFKGIDIANFNSPYQIVISGLKEDIEKAATLFESAKLYMPLKVSGAFHSRYMENARNDFELFLNDFSFSPLKISVISNVEARPYKQGDIRKLLINQITNSVKWNESIRYLMGKGVTAFEEIGPGKVLAGIIQKIQKEAEPLVIKEDLINEKTTKEQDLIQAIADDKVSPENTTNEKSVEQKVAILRSAVKNNSFEVTPESLGSEEYRKDYGIKYAYCVGGMYRGISSEDMVYRIANTGLLAYFGAGGLKPDQIEKAICNIKERITNGNQFGLNLISSYNRPDIEEATIDLLLKHGVRNIEAAAYMDISPALVRYRLNGLRRNSDGSLLVANRIQAKISRPEVAQLFLSPPPERIVKQLLEAGKITAEEAELSVKIPVAEDLCVEADSGGHTDQRSPYALMPTIIKLKDEFMSKYNYPKKIRVGAAGGIGTPEAACAAFILGADFIVTGSINQCTIEAGTSNAVKDLLQEMNVQDTDYAPAGDLFEMGAKVQVLRKGLFFPARANRLYQLYQQFNTFNEIDEKTRNQIQNKYFKKSFNDIYQELLVRYPHEREKAEKDPKYKMGLVFKWYFNKSTELALSGSEEQKVDYQVHTGPALGAFNQWVKGTELQDWRNRHVDVIAEKLMKSTAELMTRRLTKYLS